MLRRGKLPPSFAVSITLGISSPHQRQGQATQHEQPGSLRHTSTYMSNEQLDFLDPLEEIQILIEEGEFEAAETKARALQAEKIQEGWHLLAISLLHQDKEDEALEVLEDGVKSFPGDMGMAIEKAHMLTQLERFEEAEAQLESLKPSAGELLGLIDMTHANLDFARGNVDDALNRLQGIEQDAFRIDAFELQLEILEAVGRSEDIIEMAETHLDDLPVADDEDSFEAMANIFSKIANAFWEEKDDLETAKRYLKVAFHYERNNQDALWLWREMDPEFGTSPKAYTIEMSGSFKLDPELAEVAGKLYQTNYGVIAESVEEAVEFVRAYEIDAVNTDSFQVLSVEEEEAESDEAKGVYWAGDIIVEDDEDYAPNGQAKGDY